MMRDAKCSSVITAAMAAMDNEGVEQDAGPAALQFAVTRAWGSGALSPRPSEI